jgi:hypothetical protein
MALGVDDSKSRDILTGVDDGIALRLIVGQLLGTFDGFTLGNLLGLVVGLTLPFVTMVDGDIEIDGTLVGPTLKLGDIDFVHEGNTDGTIEGIDDRDGNMDGNVEGILEILGTSEKLPGNTLGAKDTSLFGIDEFVSMGSFDGVEDVMKLRLGDSLETVKGLELSLPVGDEILLEEGKVDENSDG